MSSYQEMVENLLKSIDKNDLQKDDKKLEIEHWCTLYYRLFTNRFSYALDFVTKVLSEKDAWNEYTPEGNKEVKVKLNEEVVGKKITSASKPLGFAFRYNFACWSCNENHIRNVFYEVKKKELDRGDYSLEELLERGLTSDQLMIFWSHYINRDELNDIDKNKYSYEYGFECAIKEKSISALEFFWNQIKHDSSLTQEQKDEYIMRPALYRGINTAANADMVKFSLDHIGRDKYRDLLKKDFDEKGYYSILGILKSEHCLEKVKTLFECLEPGSKQAKSGEFSFENYKTLMFGILDQIVDAPDTLSINAGYQLLDFMWHRPGFEKHQESFIKNLSSQFSPTRQRISKLIKMDRRSEVLSKILNSFNPEQKQAIERFDPVNIEILKQVMMSTTDESAAPILGSKLASSESSSSLVYKGAGDTGQDVKKPL